VATECAVHTGISLVLLCLPDWLKETLEYKMKVRIMNKNIVNCQVKQAKSKVKEASGKLTGNKSQELYGKAKEIIWKATKNSLLM